MTLGIESGKHPCLRAAGLMRFRLTRVLEWLVVGTMALLVADVLWGVMSRYALGHQSRWTEEAARMLLIWTGMLGGAAAFGSRAHLGMDALVQSFDPGARRWVALMAHGLVLAFALGILLGGGSRLVQQTFSAGQVLPALGIAKGWVYLAVPVGGAFTALYAFEALLSEWFSRPSASPTGSALVRPTGDADDLNLTPHNGASRSPQASSPPEERRD